MTPEKNQHPLLQITAVNEAAPGVKIISLQPAPGCRPLAYQAGQYLTLAFHHYGPEERRNYSIVSAPAAGGPLQIAVKRIDNGKYSRYLTDVLDTGNQVAVAGVGGFFTLPPKPAPGTHLLYICAGIGITPALSMIREALAKGWAKKITLFYSCSRREEAAFYPELAGLEQQYPQVFTMIVLESSSQNLSRARLSRALLPVLLAEHVAGSKASLICYTCGPQPYMRMVVWGLEEWGIPAAQIRREVFDTSSLHPLRLQPPDTGTHSVTVLLGGQEMQFPVQYPETILAAARRAGHSLPYSCGTGVCGSCALRCTTGKVWTSVNEVLTPAETTAGLTLTCTGHPVGGSVRLEG